MAEKTVKVELTCGRAGVNFSQSAGEEVELPADEAKRYLDEGLAVPVSNRSAKSAAGDDVETR